MGKVSLKLPRFGSSLPPPESSKRSGASQPRTNPVRVASPPPLEPLPLTPARETSVPLTPGAGSPAAVDVGSSPRMPTPRTVFLPTTPDFTTPVHSSDAGDLRPEPEADARGEAVVASQEVVVAPRARKSKKRRRRTSSVGEGGEDAVQGRTDDAGRPEDASGRHSFSFQYEGQRPFLHSGKGCASLCEKLKLSTASNSSSVPEEKNLYRELSQSSLLTVALSNQLLDHLRRKAAEERESSKQELEEVRRELEEAQKRNAMLESRSADINRRAEGLSNIVFKAKNEVSEARQEVAGLKKEVAHLREREAEVEANARRLCLRLRKSRERRVRETKNSMLSEFRGRFDMMKKYVEDTERVRSDLLTLNQATAFVDSYEALAKAGVEVPSEWVDKCRTEVASLTEKLLAEEVASADELDLSFASLVEKVAGPEDVVDGEVLFPSGDAAARAEASGRTTDGDDESPAASDREQTTTPQ